jgi:predicted porin
MIYLENDFYSNFNSIVESNDDVSLRGMLVDQMSNLIAYKKSDLVSLFKKIGINVSENPTNKELSKIIASNLKSNKKLQVGIAYLIAENNNVLQQEIKKSRPSDDVNFEGDKAIKTSDSKKPKKPIDWNKGADAVTAIAGSISVLADTITQSKSGAFEDELKGQSNNKSPEEIIKEEEDKKVNEARKKRRRKKLIIGVIAVGLIVTAIVGYKKGWFSKSEVNVN